MENQHSVIVCAGCLRSITLGTTLYKAAMCAFECVYLL